jgi:hypothetical protein
MEFQWWSSLRRRLRSGQNCVAVLIIFEEFRLDWIQA